MSLIRGAEASTLSLTLARARPAPGGQVGTHATRPSLRLTAGGTECGNIGARSEACAATRGQLCNTRMRGSAPEVFCKQSILIATRGLLLACYQKREWAGAGFFC